ncbi:fructosamine kinase family protein [Brevibacterium otitidis]|uniref:Fructosamine kinase family protein n=1 Tax=Brevibacterium otitidis TaxID=53364 RepID=A0ABV5X4I6_9MICO|nr:fructosamine kinase family protein [Brevibacterium otitidis]
MTFRKTGTHVPADFFAVEAAGLRWLAEPQTAAVAAVIDVTDTSLSLERITQAPPTREAAADFGHRLAALHQTPAGRFGANPPGAGAHYFGPLSQPLRIATAEADGIGEAYAVRLASLASHDSSPPAEVTALIDRIAAGVFDDDAAPARIHGDLWAGNLLFTSGTAVLIDPAAWAGHPLIDLGMLSLFGAPHLETIIGAWADAYPVSRLGADWRERIELYQLFGLYAHAVLFGGGYREASSSAARQYL